MADFVSSLRGGDGRGIGAGWTPREGVQEQGRDDD